MRTVVELGERDVLQIIANSFDVDTKAVQLFAKEEWRGQGPMERKVHVVTARVTLKGEAANENA